MDDEDDIPGSYGVSTLDPYVSGLAALHKEFKRPCQSVQTSDKQMNRSDTSICTTFEVTPEVVPEVYQERPLKKRLFVMNVASKVLYFLLVCAIILIISAVAHTLYYKIIDEEENYPAEKTHVVKETSTSPSLNTTIKTCLCINGK